VKPVVKVKCSVNRRRGLKGRWVKASVYEMTPKEALRLRLISNIQKGDLSPVEKGSYCFELFKVTAEERLNPDDAWNNRHVRLRLLAEISSEVGLSPQTVINWVRLESVPA